MIQGLIVIALGYALGCIVGAYYVVRLRSGTDVRASGSGNAGARNVLRTGDTVSAALTLLWDVAKGALSVWIARSLGGPEWFEGLAFAAVIAGHVWPAQLRFHGGKGAATALGAMLMIDARVTILALAAGVLTGGVARSATVGGLTAVATTPVVLVLLGASWPLAAAVAAACTVVLIAHHPLFDRRGRTPALARAQES